MKKFLCMLIGFVLLPIAAFAVKEGIVEEAAPVDLAEKEIEESEQSYLPDKSYYAPSEGIQPTWADSLQYAAQLIKYDCYEDVTQNPCLTKGEIVRAKALAADYDGGIQTGDGKSVLDQTEQVVLGVYKLNPDDFDGEKVFVLLPGTCLTDEQILAMIDAYHLLGLKFDPEGLNFRNCARGGGIETTRFLTEEETDRRRILYEQIRSGILKTDTINTDLTIHPSIQSKYYSGMENFTIRPYRSMTDEELAAELICNGAHDESGEIDFKELEKKGRTLFQKCFFLPLSIELYDISVGSYMPFAISDDGQAEYAEDPSASRDAYFVFFRYEENNIECLADVMFDAETGKPVSIIWYEDHYGSVLDDHEKVKADSSVFSQTADRYAKQIGLKESLQWHALGQISVQGSTTEQYTSILSGARCLNVFISLDGQQVIGAEIKWETAE